MTTMARPDIDELLGMIRCACLAGFRDEDEGKTFTFAPGGWFGNLAHRAYRAELYTRNLCLPDAYKHRYADRPVHMLCIHGLTFGVV